jgi:Uma2 family endonuclease
MMATAMTPHPAETPPVELHRITLDVYRNMGRLGLILPSDRVELLDGLLVKKMTKGPRHVTVTHRIFTLLLGRLPEGWYSRKEDPIELPGGPEGDNAPEPDVAVVVGRADDYGLRHPGPDDIRLVIEVATSPALLAHARQGLGRYAWAGLPAAWIVNLTNATVEVYAAPSGRAPDPRYASADVKGVGDVVSIVLDEDGTVVTFPIEDILR